MTGSLPRVNAVRYVLPLREGGSLPGLVEADDLGTYVVKFHGAGQGPKALVAEVIAGELARRLRLPVPDLVVVALDARMAVAEPDEEVQDLLRASPGDNLGMDYLPGSLGLEMPVEVDPDFAARVVWFDALVQNVDRSWRNPNLLRWHGRPWLIDHGAALYFHHSWAQRGTAACAPYPAAADHVLLPVAGPLADAHQALAPLVSVDTLRAVVDLVPESWLAAEPGFGSAAELRAAYARVLLERAANPAAWLDGAEALRVARI